METLTPEAPKTERPSINPEKTPQEIHEQIGRIASGLLNRANELQSRHGEVSEFNEGESRVYAGGQEITTSETGTVQEESGEKHEVSRVHTDRGLFEYSDLRVAKSDKDEDIRIVGSSIDDGHFSVSFKKTKGKDNYIVSRPDKDNNSGKLVAKSLREARSSLAKAEIATKH
jgi:hypothetical protein